MNSLNITRDEAHRRSTIVTAHSYRVVVDLSGRDPRGEALADPTGTFVSSSTISFTSTGGQTHVDLVADGVYAVVLDGVPLDPAAHQGNRYPISVEAGEHCLTIIALCRYSHTGEGLHRFVDPADERVYLYSQFETADARRMFATFEQPDQKATFALQVIAPSHWVVVSNSPTPEPEDGPYDDMSRWSFAPTVPIATYLTALVAGEYHVDHGTITSTKGELGADILCRQSLKEHLDADRIRHITQRGFDVYESEFDYAYPFEKYDQSFVPEFNAGAMENAGCVTHRDEYLFRSRVTSAAHLNRDVTILHELAHMWFGDLVTMKWWDDLWLNESFAEWCSYHCRAVICTQDGGEDPWVSFANQRKTWGYTQDQLPTTHPIAADMVDLDAVEQNFDGITYAKGASTLKQLVAFVGQDNFLAGVHEYFVAHEFGNTELVDLLTELHDASGRDLSDFTDTWLKTPGVNVMQADFDVDSQGNFTRFDVVQSASERFPVLRTHRMGIGIYSLRDGALVRTDGLEVDVHGERTPIAALVGHHRGDLVLLNDGDLTYAKVRLDDVSLATLETHIDAITDPLARALCWASTWDMCRDGEMTAQDYVRLVTTGLGSETDLTAMQALAAQATMATERFAAASVRKDTRMVLVSSLAAQLKAAEPGSDRQVALANGLIDAAGPEAVEVLQGWLADEEVPEGLTVDQGVRWRVLIALARLGAADEALIAAEQQRDGTSAGAEEAASARSATADAELKAAAWHLATEDPTVPNETYRHITRSFIQPGQEDLLEPYAAKYLQLCEQISTGQGQWANAGHAQVQNALTFLFPATLADRTWLDGLYSWMRDTELNSTVLRVLLERADMAERALHCQNASGARG